MDKTIGGSDIDFLSSVQQTKDSGYILGGSSFSNKSGEKTQNSRGSQDIWIVKLDDNGNMQWDKTIGGSGLDGNDRFSIHQTSDGGYIMGSESLSNKSGDKTENNRCEGKTCNDEFNPAFDYWVIKTDTAGNVQWDKTIGGSITDVCTSIEEVQPNLYLVGGASNSGISGDKTITSKGSYDYWIVKLKYKEPITTSTISLKHKDDEQITKPDNKFSVYPNPVKNLLHIQNDGTAIVSLTDQSGKILMTKTIQENNEINVSNFTSGLYYLKNNTTGEVHKIVISK